MRTNVLVAILAVGMLAAVSFGYIATRPPQSTDPYYEMVGSVVMVVDGDTTRVIIESIADNLDPAGQVHVGNVESVRYEGGIDAPETWTNPPENGALEAKEFVENITPVGTKVYVDLNHLSTGGETGRTYRDVYERLVGVIYIENNGKWINVNAEVLRWGMREYPNHEWLAYENFPAEWDYHEWLADNYPYASGSW